ncbi:sulfotransferase family 2 domain-containing protein [Ruegeria sp. 6PALISEP08]|uniref:sulfotransferase family 2 domain-containing protein n=1 Tax=Ruegeria sp. 6PALISEP08 TaxID=1225660 RepID=UPI00067F1304|nr:sulfotransferase family 2 domain-containing protein [Ruegeria sp. 6PALISEP08]
MILSDNHRFVFIHIPKCAGTSVRNAVLPFHDADVRFLKEVERHPELGEIDYRHLPLALLHDLDPEAFRKLQDYDSYALLRDPFRRFQSAMSQRAKMYLGKEFAQLDDDELRGETQKVIAYLRSGPEVVASDYIHFSRQSDFIRFNGERLVQHLYPVERLDLLVQALSRQIGTDMLEIGHANKTTVFRHPALKRATYKGSALARRLLPAPVHETLRVSARRVLMKPGSIQPHPVFCEPDVQNFVREYYAADIALYQEVLADVAA